MAVALWSIFDDPAATLERGEVRWFSRARRPASQSSVAMARASVRSSPWPYREVEEEARERERSWGGVRM